VHELIETPTVGGFRKAAFFNSVFRSNVFSGKVILLERLQQMLSRCMFFQKDKELGPLNGLNARGMYNLSVLLIIQNRDSH